MSDSRTEPGRRQSRGTILVLALLACGLHLAVNAFGGYGYFRDELYYIACSRHLAAGYVDQPPLSVFVMALTRAVLGDSVFAIRLVPALLSGLSTAVLGLIVRRLGGGRAAIALAALCFLFAPHVLAFHSYFSMNSLDELFWLLAGYALIAVVEEPRLRAWLRLGLVLGLGMLNKTSALWLAGGVAVAVVLTPGLRRQLRTAGPYAAALVAAAIASPFLVWNAVHGFPHLEFMRNAVAEKYAGLTRLRFVRDQFLGLNPAAVLVALAGAAWCFTARAAERARPLALVAVAVLLFLLANAHVKSEYAAAAYGLLFACGGLAVERAPHRAVPWLVGALVVALGLVAAPFATPVLPVETFIRYQRALGRAPSNVEGKELAELPQFFADMHGWEELARDVSAAYLTIPEAERSTTVAFVTNYGEAGALELYARRYPLPRVVSNHNAYWHWGVGPTPITTFIRLGGTREDYLDTYADVVPAGVHRARYAMPYENDLGVFVARGRKVPIEKAWAEIKHFE